jgi:competence protein ComEC
VLREVPVGLLLDGGALNAPAANDNGQQATGDVDYQNLMTVVKQRRIPTRSPEAGQRLNLGGGAVLTVLAPLEPLLPEVNNNSVVLRLDYGATSMLLTGDIEKETEERLVRRGVNLHCTILKVAHHGSNTSTTSLLLSAAQPKAAVISCGRYNRFGHPAVQTLQHLRAAKIPVFRTDVSGAIEIESDGRRCWVQTFR